MTPCLCFPEEKENQTIYSEVKNKKRATKTSSKFIKCETSGQTWLVVYLLLLTEPNTCYSRSAETRLAGREIISVMKHFILSVSSQTLLPQQWWRKPLIILLSVPAAPVQTSQPVCSCRAQRPESSYRLLQMTLTVCKYFLILLFLHQMKKRT